MPLGTLSKKAKYNWLTFLCILIVAVSWFLNIGWFRIIFLIPTLIYTLIFILSSSFFPHNYYKTPLFMKIVNNSVYGTYLLSNILLPDGGDTADSGRVFFGLVKNEKLIEAGFIVSVLCLFANFVLVIIQSIYTITIKEQLKNERKEVQNYWNKRYRDEGMIWGSEPSPTAYHALDVFNKYNVKIILVPGCGYGRNTKAFSSSFQVDGLELSSDAIQIARNWDENTNFIQGSMLSEYEVSKKYDAIYCFDLLHLLLEHDRAKLIKNCASRLNYSGGLMYFTCFSNEDRNYGIGRELEPGTFEYKANKYAHFFSEEDLRNHFKEFEIIETGSTIETLQSKDNQINDYTLRYIIVKSQ